MQISPVNKLICLSLIDNLDMQIFVKFKGAPGFEPGTSRSAVECSTTELYPLSMVLNWKMKFEFSVSRQIQISRELLW